MATAAGLAPGSCEPPPPTLVGQTGRVRVAVLSDIHANVVALDAVLNSIGEIDAIWHLGDVVGYGPEPDAVVSRLSAVGAIGVAGNHDRAALGGREIEWFNPDAKAAMEWTRTRISAETTSWLTSQPERRTEASSLLVHGSPRDPIWEYITSASIARANIDGMTTNLGLFGHTHVPMAWVEHDGRLDGISPRPSAQIRIADAEHVLVNPGSVGQPRDGDPRASWLELDLDGGTATWHRVEYDVASVQREMRRVGLPERLVERLHHGL
jgi:diadenosine tetraphosphatase ApaH/serine/threonine PP2A family protein phosphatase